MEKTTDRSQQCYNGRREIVRGFQLPACAQTTAAAAAAAEVFSSLGFPTRFLGPATTRVVSPSSRRRRLLPEVVIVPVNPAHRPLPGAGRFSRPVAAAISRARVVTPFRHSCRLVRFPRQPEHARPLRDSLRRGP